MSQPTVTIEHGQISGRIDNDLHSKPFYIFQGIPFAKPPIGDLRFKVSQPPDPWPGVLDATTEGSECMSKDMVFNILSGCEDCLTINVYTPSLPPASPRAVMVFIHGGSFKTGSSKTDMYGPEYLVAKDIVLVTFNYRVGVFGFLNWESEKMGVSGNVGLKDCVAALEWVQRNIGQFSGDPTNVTLFGESAGAALVHCLVLTPKTKGLFHKAILQSYSSLNPFTRGQNLILGMARILDLHTTDEEEIFKHLLDLPAEQLFKAADQLLIDSKMVNFSQFGPIVEQKGKDALLTDRSINILNSGDFNCVPLIIGFTDREGMIIKQYLQSPSQLQKPQDFELLVPEDLGLEPGSPESKAIAEELEEFYYGKPGAEEEIDNLYLLFTDAIFIQHLILVAKKHMDVSPANPVYLYYTNLSTKLNIFKFLFNIDSPGACHGDDLVYLFKTKISPQLEPGSIEALSVNRFTTLWSNFAKTGNPNSEESDDDDFSTIKWKPLEIDCDNYLEIGEQLLAKTNFEPERVALWKRIFDHNPLFQIK